MEGRVRRLEYRPLRAEMLEGRCLLSLGANIGAGNSPADELPLAVADNYSISPGVTLIKDVLSPPGPLAAEDPRLGVPFTTPRMVTGGQEVVETSGYSVNPGMVIVRGPGSHFWATDWMEVGDTARGRIVVELGGRMTTNNWSVVGYNSGGVGDVIVSGVGSQWTLQSHLTVSENANSQGSIRVENGGLFAAGSWAEVGRYTGAVGEVTVVGTGSRMTVARWLGVGGSGGKGMLRVGNGGVVSAGPTTIGSGGQLIGDGTIQAAVTNLGVISPGSPRGVLTIRGALSLSSGMVEFDVGGTERGAAYDGIDVLGNISGAGRAVVRFVDGFAPRAGDEFRLIEVTGGGSLLFSAVEVRGLAAGFQYELVHVAGAVVLRALTDGASAPTSTPRLGILTNDQAQDGAALFPLLVERTTDGGLTLYSNGSFRYVPNPGFQGVDAFQYQATDGFGLSAPVTATIVVGTNRPLAANDAFPVSEEATLSVSAASGLLSNDTDPLGRAMTAALFSAPAHGTATVSANGSFTYTPAVNFFGTDSFRYRVTAGGVKSNLATVTLTVTNVNDAPVAHGDTYKTRSNTPLAVAAAQGVLTNDTDPDAEPITAELVSGPTSGTLEFAADGSFNYVPAFDFHGTATFTYRSRDGVTTSNPATVTLRVNDPPVTTTDTYTVPEDGVLNVTARGVLANDSDIENDTLAAMLLNGPLAGSVTLNANGSFVYTPGAHFYGTDSFSYAASDSVNQSEATIVSIAVTSINDPPVAAIDIYRIRAGGQLNTSRWQGVLANDSDIENSPLTASLGTGPSSGSLTLEADGSLTYTPAAGFTVVASFSYRASDGAANSTAATVIINVGLAPPSSGSFINPGGGSFHAPLNWFGSSLPDSGGTARFDQARQYTVSFASDVQTNALAIGDDDVTFDLGGRKYTTNYTTNGGTFLGETPGQQPRLTLRNGTYRNDYGRFASSGEIVVEDSAWLDVDSYDSTLAGSGRIDNHGRVDFFDSSSGNLVLTDQAELNNMGTLSIAYAGEGMLELRRQAGVINSGTINMGGRATILISDDATLANFGTISVSGGGDAGDVISSFVDVSGHLVAHAGSRLNTANLRVRAGGELAGNGVISGAVVSQGTLTVGAAAEPLAIERDFTQHAGGTLAVAVAGPDQGVGYSGLSVGGRAEVSGTLVLDFVDGFLPSPGDSFVLVSAHAIVADVDGLPIEL